MRTVLIEIIEDANVHKYARMAIYLPFLMLVYSATTNETSRQHNL